MNSFLVGLDLGQAQDYTALTVVEHIPGRSPTVGRRDRVPIPTSGGVVFAGPPAEAEKGEEPEQYHLRHLERFPLGTSYPDIITRVEALVKAEPLKGKATLVADATGVGRPVVDMLRQKKIRPLIPVLITGGDTVTREQGFYRVPKRDLVSALQVLLQNGQLKFAEELPLLSVLKAELQNFKTKINLQTGHDSYEAWREREHDDLVLSLALACWYRTRFKERVSSALLNEYSP